MYYTSIIICCLVYIIVKKMGFSSGGSGGAVAVCLGSEVRIQLILFTSVFSSSFFLNIF